MMVTGMLLSTVNYVAYGLFFFFEIVLVIVLLDSLYRSTCTFPFMLSLGQDGDLEIWPRTCRLTMNIYLVPLSHSISANCCSILDVYF
jgi:hypothetical protein